MNTDRQKIVDNLLDHVLSDKTINHFWSKVDIRDEDDCWLWTGSMGSGYGYGYCHISGDVSRGAHIVSWIIHNQKLPGDLLVCHSCDVKRCVNPKHLWLGTAKDNMQDCAKKNRTLSGNNHWSKLYPDRVPVGENHWAHKNPSYLPRGIKHGMSKLSDEKVRDIRLSRLNGVSTVYLSKKYCVSKTTIKDVVSRKIWKHVD